MIDNLFRGLFDTDMTVVITPAEFLTCLGVSLGIGLILAAGLDGIENRMELRPPVNKNLFIPSEAVGLGLETLPTSLEEAVEVAKNSEFLHKFLPKELAKRYYAESLKRCAALKNAADPAEYERIHYFNAI